MFDSHDIYRLLRVKSKMNEIAANKDLFAIDHN